MCTWAVFLPAYFLRPQKQIYFIREYIMCAICIVVGYITLTWLFGQKNQILLAGDPKDMKEPLMLTIQGPVSTHSSNGYDLKEIANGSMNGTKIIIEEN